MASTPSPTSPVPSKLSDLLEASKRFEVKRGERGVLVKRTK